MNHSFTEGSGNSSKTAKRLKNSVESILTILFQRSSLRAHRRTGAVGEMTLHTAHGLRKYLTAPERRRFLKAAATLPVRQRLFCRVLAYSGGRLSEVLSLVPALCDVETGSICFQTLKRRRHGVIRQVPLPRKLMSEIEREFKIHAAQSDPNASTRRLWPWSRMSGWRYVKKAMALAGVVSAAASPKGLRHSFGVAAFQSNVPPHLIQRWLGHASLRTTSIYGEVLGPEERAFAHRIWSRY